MGKIGPSELILILVIALVIFGPKKLPEVGKSVGQAIQEFKNSMNGSSKDSSDSNKSDSDK